MSHDSPCQGTFQIFLILSFSPQTMLFDIHEHLTLFTKSLKAAEVIPILRDFSKALDESKHSSFRVNGSVFPVVCFDLDLVVYIQ